MDIHAETKVVINPAATCKSAGTKNYVCTVCGETIDTETYSNPDAHDWGTPIEGENGKMVSTCGDCGATKFVVELVNGEVSRELVDENTEVMVGDVYISLDDDVLAKVDATVGSTASGAALKLSADVLSGEDRTSATANMDEDELELLGESEIFDFNMAVDNTELSNLGGNVTVRIPYELKDGEDPDGIEVWYVKDGNVTVIDAVYHGGYVSFETNHFSYYVAVYLTPVQRCERDGHDYTESKVAATCTENGYVIQTCKLCGNTKISEPIVANGHIMMEETVQIANCKQQGIIRHYCKNCDYEMKLETELGDHTRGSDGKCTVCGINVDCKHDVNVVSFVELAPGSDTCLDGVIIKNYCLTCESIIKEYTKEGAHVGGIPDADSLFNFHPYGAPGYIMKQSGCACGGSEWHDNFYIRTSDWSFNSGDWTSIHNQEYTDDKGMTHSVSTWTSNSAKLKVEMDTCVLSQKGCDCETDKQIKIYVDGTLVKEMGGIVIEKQHYYGFRVSLNEGSETCLDGVTVEEYCLRCGEEYTSWTTKSHVFSEIKSFDLSDYSENSCNGVLVHGSRCACGFKNRAFTYNGDRNCGLASANNSSVVDDTGKRIYTEARSCETCGFVVTDVYTLEDSENCKVNQVGTLTITVDGVVKETYEYSLDIGTKHKNTYCTVELTEGSTTCEDGVVVTEHCLDCQQVTSTSTSTEHTLGTKYSFDISQYGDVCGDGVFSWMSCACGASQKLVLPSTCKFTKTTEKTTDENGITHTISTCTCSNCDISYIADVVQLKKEGCTATFTEMYEFYFADSLYEKYSVTLEKEAHNNYVSEVALNEGSETCEDGITSIIRCYDCDYSRIYATTGHSKARTRIDMSKYGSVCGGYFYSDACACGEIESGFPDFACDYGSWSSTDSYQYVGEENGLTIYRAEFTCNVENCGFTFVMEQHMQPAVDGTSEGMFYFCLDEDGDGISESKYPVQSCRRSE